MTEHLLEVKNLRARFQTVSGDIHAVRGVSFYLDAGETLAIVGESGCGKSVTVQSLMRLNSEETAKVSADSILYKGEELSEKTDKEMRAYRGKEFAMIFQDAMTSLNPVSRVGRQLVEAILVHEKISREDARKRAVDMLGRVGLPNPENVYTRYPHTLSGGQRQRVMIAMSLCCHPSILIADEPTTALDVTTQAQILKLMKDLQKETGCAIILITHNLGVVARTADRVAVMYAGQMIEKGNLRDIFYRPKHPYTWGLLGSMPDRRSKDESRLVAIPGAIPDLYKPPAGCSFAARCIYCMNVCLGHCPEEYPVGKGHVSRCWLLDERCREKPVPPQGRDRELITEEVREAMESAREEGLDG